MAFENLPPSKPQHQRKKNAAVFCVGWRAFVNGPRRGAQAPGPVPLTDVQGKAIANDLADGQQVEIVSWRPRSRLGMLYQVRRVADGTEWWIEATYLRREAVRGDGADAAPETRDGSVG